MPLIGSPEDEHACRRQDSRSGARAGIPALLLLSFSLIFNQDEKPGDHEGLTKSSFAPIPEPSSLGPDSTARNAGSVIACTTARAAAGLLPHGACWAVLEIAAENEMPSSGLLGDARLIV